MKLKTQALVINMSKEDNKAIKRYFNILPRVIPSDKKL